MHFYNKIPTEVVATSKTHIRMKIRSRQLKVGGGKEERKN